MKQPNLQRVSVVVPTYSQHGKLRRLLKSFDSLEGLLPLEVIVVDDCSPDETGEVVKDWIEHEHEFSAEYIMLKENSGPGRARNVGTGHASGDIVAFTDSDCVAHKNWLRELVKEVNPSMGVIGVGGKVKPLNGGVLSRYSTFHRILAPPKSLIYLVTANCCYIREKILEVDGFDEEIPKPGGEDVALSIKLMKKGWKFHYSPMAVVYHEYRTGLGDFVRTFENYGEGCSYVTGKYLGGEY